MSAIAEYTVVIGKNENLRKFPKIRPFYHDRASLHMGSPWPSAATIWVAYLSAGTNWKKF